MRSTDTYLTANCLSRGDVESVILWSYLQKYRHMDPAKSLFQDHTSRTSADRYTLHLAAGILQIEHY